MKIMTWLWMQTPNRAGYDAEKVNRWAEGMRANLTIPHTLAVVTDEPAGIDPSIEVIPLPRDFLHVRCTDWAESAGLPQCYRRLKLFDAKAGEYFGDDDLVSMDLDSLPWRNMDGLFAEPCDFRMFAGTSAIRPYNGSMVRIRAGARRQVFDQFAADPAGMARAARAKYIGSDQAVISMILGRGERTWGEADGVYHFGQKLERIYSKAPPSNLALLFFPGHIKPWDKDAARLPWLAGGYIPEQQRRTASRPLRIRAYNDPKGWGQAFTKAARERGHFVTLFTRARQVSSGVAFVRLDQQGPQREVSRRIVEDLNRQGVRTLPTAREALWYDDKGAQLPALRKWMPDTHHFRNSAEAEAFARTAAYPFISKSIDGAASQGVRIIPNLSAALSEVKRAFAAPGIPSTCGRRQLGYVYWQRLVPGNDCDYRVCIVGEYFYGLIRKVRPGTIMASGSGIFENLTLSTPRERSAAELAVAIAKEIKTDWMAFDIVFDEEDRPLVLEMSSAWTMKAYESAPCYSRETMTPTYRTGAESFTIAVEIVEGMCRSAAQLLDRAR